MKLSDAKELHVKESDRIAATVENLTRMGALIDEHADGWHLHGGAKLHGADLSSLATIELPWRAQWQHSWPKEHHRSKVDEAQWRCRCLNSGLFWRVWLNDYRGEIPTMLIYRVRN